MKTNAEMTEKSGVVEPLNKDNRKRVDHLEFAQNLKSANIATKVMSIWSDGKGHKKGYIHNVLNYNGFNIAYINSFIYPANKPHEISFSSGKGPLWEVNHQKIVVVNDYDEEIPLYDLGDIITEFTDIENFDLSVFDEDDIKLEAQAMLNSSKEANESIVHEDNETELNQFPSL